MDKNRRLLLLERGKLTESIARSSRRQPTLSPIPLEQAAISSSTNTETEDVPVGAFTPRRMRREPSHRREALAELVMARIPIIACELTTDGTTLFVNELVTRITGYQPLDLLGRNWWDTFCPNNLARQVDDLYARLRLGDVKDYPMILLGKDGSPKQVAWTSLTPLRSTGASAGIVLFGVDMTEHDELEIERGRLNKRIRKLEQDLTVRLTRSQEQAGVLHTCVENLQQTIEGVIQGMALMVEMRDPYTAGHQKRVAELACAIAAEMGLSEEQTRLIRLAASVHDIGKIGIPSEILSKPGRINDFEFQLIKEHSRTGYDIIKPMRFPWPVAEIVLQHHEAIDGSGYPNGLRTEEILVEARILAVADVVEAMASHRPYRPALGIDEALDEISQNRGILYDSAVVDSCLSLVANKGFKVERNTNGSKPPVD